MEHSLEVLVQVHYREDELCSFLSYSFVARTVTTSVDIDDSFSRESTTIGLHERTRKENDFDLETSKCDWWNLKEAGVFVH